MAAPTLAELLHRSAAGMLALIYEADPGSGEAPATPRPPSGDGEPPAAPERVLELEADDAASLIAAWLRELLYLHEVHGFAYEGAEFETLEERRLRARVRAARPAGAPAREIKGVTYHGLSASRDADGWHARVIFDV